MLKIYNIKEKQEYLNEVLTLEMKEWSSDKNLTKERLDKKINKIKSLFNNKYFCKLILLDEDELVGFISIFPEDFYGRVPAAAKLDFSPLVYKDKSPRLTLTASCKNPYVHPSVILENDSVRGELRNLLIFHKCLILEEKVNPYSISFEVESDGRKVFSEIGDFVEKNNLYLSGLKMSRLGSDGAAVLLDFMKVANETADNGTSANETSANETAANAGRLLKSAGSSFFEIKKNRQKSYTGNVQKSDSEIKNKVGEVIKADGERIVYYKDDEGRMKSIVLKEEK